MKKLLKDMRSDLKKMAAEIKELKGKRKGAPNGVVPGLDALRVDFRYLHIVRCLLRGRQLVEIEVATKNPLNEFTLRRVWLTRVGLEYPKRPEVVHEALRACAP